MMQDHNMMNILITILIIMMVIDTSVS